MSTEQAQQAYERMAAMFGTPRTGNDLTAEVWIERLHGLDIDLCRVSVDAVLAELDWFPSWHQFRDAYDGARVARWNQRTIQTTGTICGQCGKQGGHMAWCDGSGPIRAPGQRGDVSIRHEWSSVKVHPKDGQRGYDMTSHGRDDPRNKPVPLTAERRTEQKEIAEAAADRATIRYGHKPGNI